MQKPKSGKPKKNTKTLTISKVKKELDRVFSIYVRTKYSENGIVQCYTCPKRGEIKEMQNGHFVPRQYLATRYHEMNCRPQCYACNMLYNGQPSAFATRLEQEEKGIVKKLEALRHQSLKWYVSDYLTKIEHYKKKIEKLSTGN